MSSCNSFNGGYKCLEPHDVKPLREKNSTIIEYRSDYPVGIYKSNDSIFLVLQAMSDTCFHVLNSKNKECLYMGTKGLGEREFMNPNIISTIDKSMLLLEDSNLKKIVRVDIVEDSVNIDVNIPYPDVIFPAKELNLSNNYMVGRKVGPYEKLFFIFDKRSGEMIEIDNYPETPYDFVDKNYTFAPVLALNEKEGRIILGMYFFDIIQIYSLKGEYIGGYSFQENYMPSYDRDNRCVDLSKDYSGMIRSFSTEKYCYFLRKEMTDLSLVQLDWNGNLVNHYQLPDNVIGQFYIDEKKNLLYIIQKEITDSYEEIYSIVSYELI